VKLTTRAFTALEQHPDIGRAEALRQAMLVDSFFVRPAAAELLGQPPRPRNRITAKTNKTDESKRQNP